MTTTNWNTLHTIIIILIFTIFLLKIFIYPNTTTPQQTTMLRYKSTQRYVCQFPSISTTTSNSATTAERQNRTWSFPSTPYNTRTNAAALNLHIRVAMETHLWLLQTLQIPRNLPALARCTFYTYGVHMLLNTPVTHIQLLCIAQLFLNSCHPAWADTDLCTLQLSPCTTVKKVSKKIVETCICVRCSYAPRQV